VDAIDWLLDSDPAIRWQALRDLTDATMAEIAAERARVAHEGLGTAILARQEPDGAWRKPDEPAWVTTLFTMQFLRATGADPADPAVEAAAARPQMNLCWNDLGEGWNLRPAQTGGNPFFDGEEEPCINGGVLALSGYFGHPSERLAQRLLGEQLDDGGWNCEAPKSTRSSFHTTICVLEGLLEYERAVDPASPLAGEVESARWRGEEYLLERALFRRRSTGEVANQEFLDLAFPPRYHYDILRALDYFRAAAAPPDPRMREAVDVIAGRRNADGMWLLDRAYDEAIAVPTGEAVGEPSRWNTLRALRVLRWWEQRGPGPRSA
jgi:hypothetical protein